MPHGKKAVSKTPMDAYADGCRATSISTAHPTRTSRRSSSRPTSRPVNASGSRRHSKPCLPSSERTFKSASLSLVALRSGIQGGQLERLLRSGARFAEKAIVLDALDRGEATTIATRRVGPALAFERMWEETGCRGVIERLASARKHDFSLERAAFLTVLHRLFCGGSDRAADSWREDYRIDGVEDLGLHHLYRAMAWLGEELPEDQQDGATPFAPRFVKDVLEEELFACRRDLLTTLDIVFMDTTSLYFEGAGGQTLGRRGFSKDHRPDLNQMILAVLLDGDGRPVCTEMWPGNTADVTSLIPAIDRL